MIWRDNDGTGGTKPFLEHLEDLRRTILWCAAFLVAGFALAAPLAPVVVHMLKLPLAEIGIDPDRFLKVIRTTGGISIAMRVIFWSGLLFALPGMIAAIAAFVFPGLTRAERKWVVRATGFAAVLFAGGVALGFTITLPMALRVMFRVNVWLGVQWDFVQMSDYIAFVLKLLIAFGLVFELPVIVLALGAVGILSSAKLRHTRRHVIVGVMVVAMLLTPPDPLTLLLMAAPMALLYEMCIWLIWLKEKRGTIA